MNARLTYSFCCRACHLLEHMGLMVLCFVEPCCWKYYNCLNFKMHCKVLKSQNLAPSLCSTIIKYTNFRFNLTSAFTVVLTNTLPTDLQKRLLWTADLSLASPHSDCLALRRASCANVARQLTPHQVVTTFCVSQVAITAHKNNVPITEYPHYYGWNGSN